MWAVIWDMTSNVSYLNEKASGSRKTQSPDLYRLPAFEHDLVDKRNWQLKKKIEETSRFLLNLSQQQQQQQFLIHSTDQINK